MLERSDRISSLIKLNDELQTTINSLSSDLDHVRLTLNQSQAEMNRIRAERDKLHLDLHTANCELEKISNSRLWMICQLIWSIKRELLSKGLILKTALNPLTLPRRVYQQLPSALRELIRWGYLRFQKVHNEPPLPQVQVSTPTFRPETRVTSSPDYIVWGVNDWHSHQQRIQQQCRELAATGCRIFYITSQLLEDQRLGFEFEKLDESARIFQIKFRAPGAPSILDCVPHSELVRQLRIGLGEMLQWTGTNEIVSIVQHPFWYDVARAIPNNKLVYDCIDPGKVRNTGEAISRLEETLLRQADLTITTSTDHESLIAPFAAKTVTIEDGCQFEHFAIAPVGVFRDPERRKVIGYFGEITEHFDQDLVAEIAKRFPEALLLLIGNDAVGAAARLGGLPNVTMVGEVPYSDLPYFAHGFDVSILPFKVDTPATDTIPINVFEYLSLGKPVVAIDLPEIEQLAGLVHVASQPDEFFSTLAQLLTRPFDKEDTRRRRQFAQEQTWSNRANRLISEIERLEVQQLVSVIVVTYNNIELTRICLASLDEQPAGIPLEVIVVDNHSTDGSREFLMDWSTRAPKRRLILNDDNRGFAAANNQGLQSAKGDYMVLLNNDTHVTPGWARTLVNHLRHDESIGLIGPVTNNIGNEAKIDITYDSMSGMLSAASNYTRKHLGMLTPLRTAAFFCVMLSRDIYHQVGLLDENFGRGFFEDDDYCRRVEQHGRRIVCAEDVFVHHQLSASFNKLVQPERIELFERNKAYYESKWGKWIPHEARRE